MKIINDNLSNELKQGIPIKLDLGCGEKKLREGFYGLDHIHLEGIDILADLNEPLNLLPDGCVEHLFTSHTLEHIDNFLPLMKEFHRITKPDGIIEIVVPHFSNVYGFSDPTHVRFFGLYSMYYFTSRDNQPKQRKVHAFYSDVRFIIDSVKIEFYNLDTIDRLLAPLFTSLVNRNIRWQNFYERRLSSLFHAQQIRFIMRPDKSLKS